MNRIDFQEIAETRIREARALLTAGFPDGAYYLAGYAVECALKSCIAKRTREHDFPEKKLVNDSHTHDLGKLLQLAELKDALDAVIGSDPAMESALDKIQDWSETSRYQRKTVQEAAELLKAIEDQTGGLLPWIRLHW
ncbi:MAG: HEPN domain-containing protein [Terracidiphilus sp.]|nr:HEPN domain-containing protein [Terracidiphilus sp.]